MRLASGAETILVPEVPHDMDEITARMEQSFALGKRHSIVIVAEGVGSGEDVAKALTDRCPTLEPRVTCLGHIQRGERRRQPTGTWPAALAILPCAS